MKDAEREDVAFLVVGDPFGATTHTDLYLRAVERAIPVKVIHNASIINAVGVCGLQLYSFGPIITIPFWTDNWRPDSPYLRLEVNWRAGQHTLCLLDIKVKEQSEENLLRGRKVYEPPRFMTVKQAVMQLLESETRHGLGACTASALGVAMMRIGSEEQKILTGTLAELSEADEELFGGPLHSFILPAMEMHALEYDMLRLHALEHSILRSMTFQQYTEKIKTT